MAEYPPGIRPDGAGLRIRLFRGGKCIYSETLKGNPQSKSLIAAAERKRKWLKARQELGLPLTEREAGSTLFEDVAQGYMDSLDAKHSTHISYENIINGYWMPLFGGWPLEEITTRIVKEALAGFSVSRKTKRNVLIPLRGILAHGEINPNPCDAIRFKRSRGASPAAYTPAQRAALMKAIGRAKVPDWLAGQPAAYFALLFGCGLRPCGEPLALEWPDYDGQWLTVSKQITKRRVQPYTKTDLARRVYVPTWARPHLDSLPTRFDGGYLFQNSRGGPHLDSDAFNPVWQKAHRLARISYQEPYACRHTRASELLSTGVNPADAAKQLGHSVEMFMRTYADWVEQYAGELDPARFEGVTAEKSNIRQSGSVPKVVK